VWPELVLIATLVVINAILAGSEIALISLREPQLDRMERKGGAGLVTARLARDPNRFLATIQIGITLAGFLASAVAAVSLAEPIVGWFTLFGDAAETVAIIVVTVILSLVTLVLGELTPKRLALQRSETWALAVGRPLHWFAVAATPLVWFLSVSTDVVVRLFGGTPGARREEVDLEELRETIVARGHLPAGQHEVLLGAFEVAERTVQEVMTPRPDVYTLDAGATVASAIECLLEAGHTRAPVTASDRGLDSAIGVVSLQDLAGADPRSTIRSHTREAQAIPESLRVLVALRRLQAGRQQMAFIVDEFGGIEGIVTVEDLIEELVGEIYDQSDLIVATPRAAADGSILVPGRFPVHDLAEFGITVPSGDYTTVAGLVLDAAGRLPDPGDEFTVGRWTVTVMSVTGRSITDVRFSVLPG
jgi:putative hemolysin